MTLEAQLKNLARNLFPMQQGTVSVRTHDVLDFAEDVVLSAQQSIDATSYVSFSDWWATEEGRRYLTANYDAVQRGVFIRRVFIFPSRAECNMAQPYLIEQIDNRINVRLTFSNKVEPTMLRDIIIVDGECAGQMGLNENRENAGAPSLLMDSACKSDRGSLILFGTKPWSHLTAPFPLRISQVI